MVLQPYRFIEILTISGAGVVHVHGGFVAVEHGFARHFQLLVSRQAERQGASEAPVRVVDRVDLQSFASLCDNVGTGLVKQS